MTRGRRKPSFDVPSSGEPEASAWVYRSEDEAPAAPEADGDSTGGAAIPASMPPLARAGERPTSGRVIDAVTYPFALVTTMAIFPVARLGALFRGRMRGDR